MFHQFRIRLIFFLFKQASKTLEGERYRVLEINQLLSTVEKAAESLRAANRAPAIIITVRCNNSLTFYHFLLRLF